MKPDVTDVHFMSLNGIAIRYIRSNPLPTTGTANLVHSDSSRQRMKPDVTDVYFMSLNGIAIRYIRSNPLPTLAQF